MMTPDEMAATRYKPVRAGFWWRVTVGDGQQTVGRCYTETEAQRLAAALTSAFLDGAFVERQHDNSNLRAERDALRAALEQARPALEHAATICDGVPTRDPGYLGQLVNFQPNGFHGYRLIHDARDVVRAALENTNV